MKTFICTATQLTTESLSFRVKELIEVILLSTYPSRENKEEAIQLLHTSVQETKTLKIEVSVEDEPRSRSDKHQRKFSHETDQIL